MIAEFITPVDSRWKRFLQTTPHDYYHLPEYVELCARYEGVIPAAFYAEHGQASFMAPLLIRTIPQMPGAPEGWYDCSSPYGYSPPLIAPSQECLENFLGAFCNGARQRGIVTAFFRLHPLLSLDHGVLGKFGQLANHGQTVYVDLSKSRDDIWHQTREDHRRYINRLVRLGFRVILDDWSFLDDFIAIYHMTMQRVGARQDYLFSREYFEEFRAALGSHIHLCSVLSKDGDLASGGTYVDWNGIVQGHLAGTATKYLSLSPSKLMHDFIRSWAKETSNKVFHLGGGVGGARDSLFEYKSGFSKSRADFFTYRMILDEEKHDALMRLVKARFGESNGNCSNFFPLYRQYDCALATPTAKTQALRFWYG